MHLQDKLDSDEFTVLAEMEPPKGVDVSYQKRFLEKPEENSLFGLVMNMKMEKKDCPINRMQYGGIDP